MEEEIDLRPYIKTLIQSWRWIVLATVLTGVFAYLISTLFSNVYETKAIVAAVRENTDVSFNASLNTGDEILNSRHLDTRLEGLVALVNSNDIAAEVLAEIGDELDEDYQSVPAIINLIESSNTGDLIIINAQYNDPQLTAKLANTWADVYERHVNNLYGSGKRTGQSELAAQVVTAKEDYETAKTNLESFVADNRIALLQNEIAAQTDLLASYQEARTKIQSNPVDFQVNTRQDVLQTFYSDLGNIELLLADANSLREQIAEGSGSAAAKIANGLALISLQNRISRNSNQSIILQFDLTNETIDPVRLSDVDAVIDTLETRRTETLAQIETFSLSFASVEPDELLIDDDHPINRRIVELNDSILALRAELSTQTSQERELNQELDLAWNTYQALADKENKVEISSDSIGSEVRIASKAATPDKPIGTGGLTSALIGMTLGGMAAILVITAVYWWSGPAIAETGESESSTTNVKNEAIEEK